MRFSRDVLRRQSRKLQGLQNSIVCTHFDTGSTAYAASWTGWSGNSNGLSRIGETLGALLRPQKGRVMNTGIQSCCRSGKRMCGNHWSWALCATLMLVLSTPLVADCPPCGPLYCVDTGEYQSALAQKKSALSNKGYPARLVALFDKLDHCKGCIDTSPDGFSLFTIGINGSIDIRSWTKDGETAAVKAIADGTSKSCFVIIVRRSCSCCKQPKYNERSDYDQSLDLNKKATLQCGAAS
jgi:hypothetical protein